MPYVFEGTKRCDWSIRASLPICLYDEWIIIAHSVPRCRIYIKGWHLLPAKGNDFQKWGHYAYTCCLKWPIVPSLVIISVRYPLKLSSYWRLPSFSAVNATTVLWLFLWFSVFISSSSFDLLRHDLVDYFLEYMSGFFFRGYIIMYVDLGFK